MIIRSFSFYKNILKNRKKIYIYQTIILHVLQLLKKDKSITKTRTKKEKKGFQKTLLVRSQTNFSTDDVQLLILEIVVPTVHEYK